MRNPLQLVKDLVLLIVEARTPDFTVKGRIEGPHCPIIRGRPAHKCSADKVEVNILCCFPGVLQKITTHLMVFCIFLSFILDSDFFFYFQVP